MTELVFKQFELARGWCIEVAESVPEKIVNVQPAGFNNTIQWHIGYILTVTEYFMFGISPKKSNFPANFTGLFGPGTKPADWKGDVPSANELITHLKGSVGPSSTNSS
ncbi:DinB family protein [Bacillus sp. V59.32b]|uniref:DinB family protein n=1 Tax=Bacillus sp. V59.32b TaxID=1758642 RepID=UPI00268829F3